MNNNPMEEVKQAISNVIRKRKDRGATSEQITSYLTWLKNGTWRNNDTVKEYINELLNDIQIIK